MITLMAGIVARSFILNRMMEIGMQATAILEKTNGNRYGPGRFAIQNEHSI
jgi:hypothetical protein